MNLNTIDVLLNIMLAAAVVAWVASLAVIILRFL